MPQAVNRFLGYVIAVAVSLLVCGAFTGQQISKLKVDYMGLKAEIEYKDRSLEGLGRLIQENNRIP